VQLVSCAAWVRNAPANPAAGAAGSGGSAQGNIDAVRFWLCEDRLKAMLAGEWQAYVLTTDMWLACTQDPIPLSACRIVSRADISQAATNAQ
jgi:hypothetical protein